jgi:rubrerythrin
LAYFRETEPLSDDALILIGLNHFSSLKGEVMVDQNLTALEALGIAIRSELDVEKLYQELASRTENDLLKDRFLNLYQEERRHQFLLEKKYQEMFPNVNLKIPPSQLPKEIVDQSLSKNFTIKDVLKFAIDEERRLKEFYLDYAETDIDLSGKRMFRFLADLKFSHEMKLTAELEMIEKYPAYYGGAQSWEAEIGFKTEGIKQH